MNEIVSKNYLLRENFYILEKSIHNSLDIYHKEIRDYQYEMEIAVQKLTQDINSTMDKSLVEKVATTKDLIVVHNKKKIYSVVSHIGDIIEKKKWDLKINKENKYDIFIKNELIGSFEVQLKKTTLNFPKIQLDLIFNAGNNKQNNQNLILLEKINY